MKLEAPLSHRVPVKGFELGVGLKPFPAESAEIFNGDPCGLAGSPEALSAL